MRTPKRFSISKCLLRRRAMLDARFSQDVYAIVVDVMGIASTEQPFFLWMH